MNETCLSFHNNFMKSSAQSNSLDKKKKLSSIIVILFEIIYEEAQTQEG